MTRRVLVARLDSDGYVLLSGPAVRAIAAGWAGTRTEVTLLCGPAGAQAADLLPGVDHIVVWDCPWIAAHPEAVRPGDVRELTARIAAGRFDVAVVLTSAHQSCLPLALVLRMAGVQVIAGISTDYPGALLDVRMRPDIDFAADAPEPERALAVAHAVGCRLPDSDDDALRVRPTPDVSAVTGAGPYLVLHPGATGFAELAGVLRGAAVVVIGNTGPAHLAAAVGTPVVSLFSPVVPAVRWAPYRVPTVLLGDQTAPCRGTGARECPIPGHPCLSSTTARDVVDAVRSLQTALT